MNDRILIQIACRDRHTELALLLQSLRTQTYQDFDIVILDECQTPITQNYFLLCITNRIKYENHGLDIIRNDMRLGVCNARNLLIEKSNYNKIKYVARIDDDCILQPDYFEKLLNVINTGYDIASGVTPSMQTAPYTRHNHHLNSYINKKEIDYEGNITKYGDDCGSLWLKEEILPADEFRSNALMKKEVIDNIQYEKNLSPVGFREEGFFSTRAKKQGYKIGVNTAAVAWHLQTPTGGCRSGEYVNNVQSDDKYFKKWFKQIIKNGDK